MLTKRFLYIALIILCINSYADNTAFCSETYFIDGRRVLLYKIINWWYDCLPEESSLLCRRPIKCKNRGNALIEYNEADRVLNLNIKDGFAELLSISRQSNNYDGPTHLQCKGLNRKYFGLDVRAVVPKDFRTTNSLIFHNVNEKEAQKFFHFKNDIVFVLEGVIFGLLNGKIALHPSGNFLINCPKAPLIRNDHHSITLKLIDSNLNEVFATYSAVRKN